MTHIDFILDTDVLIEILRGNRDAGLWLETNGNKIIGLPVFVYMEALMGACSKKEFTELKFRLAEFPLIKPVEDDAATAIAWFDKLRISHGVGIIDCFIGAIAKRCNLTLFTFNTKHFTCLEGVILKTPYKR
jgi:tRNA(fMet)-specific endonuclease VapC